MQLDAIAAELRPRRPWEAVDLGFAMTRRWWRPIMALWAVIVLPACLLIGAGFWWSPPLAALAIWWLKPLWDRVVLFVLGRQLFGSRIDAKVVRRELAPELFRGLFSQLTWLRFDPARSFSLPVWQLERLSGSQRRQRSAVLRRVVADSAGLLTLLGLTFELFLLIGLLATVQMMVPPSLEFDVWNSLDGLFDGSASPGFRVLALAIVATALTLVEPFYVGGGFALYLNRRTLLEGWDVEIGLRRLAARLAAPALALLVGLFWVAPALADDAARANDAQSRIQSILAEDDFGQHHTERQWIYVGPEIDWPSWEAPAIGSPGKLPNPAWVIRALAFVALAALALTGIVVGIRQLRRWRMRPPPDTRPTTLFGLEVRPESLPTDIAAEARRLWRDGRPVEALSLLYRGALTRLIYHDGIPFEASWTERECCVRVQRLLAADRSDFFTRLTTHWQTAAYGHRVPETELGDGLCRDWARHFEVRRR